MADETTKTETANEKLARLRAEKVARDAARQQKIDAAQIEGLELEAKYSAELGDMGTDFAMVDCTSTGDGWIVVKLGEDLPFRQYVDAVLEARGELSAAEQHAFVSPALVYPSQDAYAALVMRKAHYAKRACNALAALHGVRQKEVEGKF